MIDAKITKHIKNTSRVLLNENGSSVVQEKVKECFKSLYSLKGL
jgi:hypothetical protein